MNIEEYIKHTDWKFSDLLQLEKTSRGVANKILQESEHVDLLNLVWDETIPRLDEPMSFGSYYNGLCVEILTKQVMEAFQKYFESATVSFDPSKVEEKQSKWVSDKVVTPPPPVKKEKTITTFTKGEDGLDIPSGVKRV